MSRVFSIPTVLRMTANPLLRAFFDRLGHVQLGIPWAQLRKRDVLPIINALATLAPSEYARVECELRSVFDLACESGVHAIREASASLNDDTWTTYWPLEGGPYSQVMWVWLHHRAVFERACLLHGVSDLSWWRKRGDLPRRIPRRDPNALQELAQSISNLLQREQGRGKVCTVETVHRDGTDYFVAHPDDFVKNVTIHDDDGHLAPYTLRRTFTIVFAFRADDGSLEMFARVPAKLKPRLEELFAKTMLGVDLGALAADAFELNHLKHRSFALVTAPDDCVRVHIRRLRLAIKNTRRRITVEADPGKSDDIHAMLDDVLNKERLPLTAVNVTLASLCFEFLPIDGRKAGSMTFDVAYPHTCNLRHHRPDRVEVATKYLKRWGIDVAGRSTQPMAAVG